MTTPLQKYKEFIDALVEITPSVAADRIRRGVWHPEPPEDQVKLNDLVTKLSPEDRELIAEIVQDAASSAIHDVLVRMHDDEYRIQKDGTELPQEPFDSEPYYDYVCRREGDSWPK